MPTYTESPYNNTFDKLLTLEESKQTKLTGTAPQNVEYETHVLQSMNDTDTLQFEGVTGGKGRPFKDGTVYDRTDVPSADRLAGGYDGYEVYPSSQEGYDYLFNSKQGIAKMERQRARLAASRGVPVEQISNGDVFQQGTADKIWNLAWLKAQSEGDEAKIQAVRNWEPPEELTSQYRDKPDPFGRDISHLGIELERHNTGEFGRFGRPLTTVRFPGSEFRIGEERGGKYDDAVAQFGELPSVDALSEASQRAEAERMDFWDRLGNGLDGLQKTVYREVGLDLADFVGEGLNYLTDGAVGWDIGTSEEKEKMASDFAGFNRFAAEEEYAKAHEHAANIYEAITGEKEFDAGDAYELVKIGLTTPELAGESFGHILSMFVPVLGWGGKAAKAGKVVKQTKAALKAGDITESVAKARILEAKAGVHVLNKAQTFVQQNAGLLQMSAGNVNDQVDAYKEMHGEAPSMMKLSQMFVTEGMLLGIDRWSAVGIMKSPTIFKGAGEAFSILPKEGKAKVLGKIATATTGLGLNMAKEAAQEYVQEIGQEFNVRWNFDDNGNITSALDEAGNVLLERDVQIAGITGAGLGAGGAGQFAAAGYAGKALGKAGDKAGLDAGKLMGDIGKGIKGFKKDKDTVKEPPLDTVVAEEEVDEETKEATYSQADKTAAEVAMKYSGMVTDEETINLMMAEGDAVEKVSTPHLRDKLKADSSNYKTILEELETSQAVVEARMGTPRQGEHDDMAVKIFRKARKEVLTALMEEENDGPTLGSGIAPEDIVDAYLENAQAEGITELPKREQELLAAYANKHKIPPYRFGELKAARGFVKPDGKKDSFNVWIESMAGGSRSAANHRKKLGTLVNTPNPSRAQLKKVTGDIDKFLASQETRKEAFDAVKDQVSADVKAYNKRIAAGESVKPGELKRLRKRHKVPGYDSAFVEVVNHKDGNNKLQITRPAYDISRSMDDTINYLRRTKEQYKDKVNKILGDEAPADLTGIVVPPSRHKAKQRDADLKRYENLGVTKVVTGDTASAVWKPEGDYFKENAERTDSSGGKVVYSATQHSKQDVYTKDDVVLITSTAKTKDEFFEKEKAIMARVKKIQAAGASIVVHEVGNDRNYLRDTYLPSLGKTKEDSEGTTKDPSFVAVKVPGGTMFMSDKEKWTPHEEKRIKKEKYTQKKEETLQGLLVAMDVLDMYRDPDADHNPTLEDLYKEGKLEQEMYESLTEDLNDATEYFQESASGKSSDTQKMEFYINRRNAQVQEIVDKYLKVIEEHGPGTAEVDAMKQELKAQVEDFTYMHSAWRDAEGAIEARAKELEEGGQVISAWKEAVDAEKAGGPSATEWANENLQNPKGVMQDVLANAIGTDFKYQKLWVKYAPEGSTSYPSAVTHVSKVGRTKNDKGEWDTVPHQVLEVNPSNYVEVAKPTVFNTMVAKDLRVEGRKGMPFNALVKDSVNTLKEVIRPPSMDKLDGGGINFQDFANSPATSLLFDKDLEINENVAAALTLGFDLFLKDNAYLLQKGKKSVKDIAQLLGKEETQVTNEMVKLLGNSGLMYKTAANHIGRHIGDLLGIQPKSDTDADKQAYQALLADLGQVSLLAAEERGLIHIDNASVKLSVFNKVVLGKEIPNTDEKATVLFIKTPTSGKNKAKNNLVQSKIDTVIKNTKNIVEMLPDVDVGRVEPRFKAPDGKRLKRMASGIRKDLLGMAPPKESAEAIKKRANTEYVADLKAIKDLLDEDVKPLVMARLGYIDPESDEFANLARDDKDSQEAINRGIERNLEHLEWLVSTKPDEEQTSLWFDQFFSKNGRFFIESNTINPETNKHLDRFLVQPKDHWLTFTVLPGKGVPKFTVKGKKVTNNVYYALAQAFGYSTDKKATSKNLKFARTVFGTLNTVDKVKAARQQFLETGKVKLRDGFEIKQEHFAHAMQAFNFIEEVAGMDKKGGTFNSALSAEFDAVTSGFGLKQMQMPILKTVTLEGMDTPLGQMDWLEKVGIILKNSVLLGGLGRTAPSMNDVLDIGGLLDSYETLGAGVKPMSFEKMLWNAHSKDQIKDPRFSVVQDSEFNRNLWDALSEALPSVTDSENMKESLAEVRKIFKYPFMTFNYSASIKNIRKNLLTGDIVSTLFTKMAAADIRNEDDKFVRLMRAYVGPEGNLEKLQHDIRNEYSWYVRKSKDAKPLDKYLREMVEASYGSQAQKILTTSFAPFEEVQANVNDAFKGMFLMFEAEFTRRVNEARKEGAITAKKEKEIYQELKDRWPVIKGPITAIEEDISAGIAVYSSETISPYGTMSGRKPVRANVTDKVQKRLSKTKGEEVKSIRTSHMVKQISAAVSAGSVTPIHYIDGAILARLINNLSGDVGGIMTIHDAIIPPLDKMGEAQEEYNKQVLKISREYSVISEIARTLDRMHTMVDLDSDIYKTVKVDIKLAGEYQKVSLAKFMHLTQNRMVETANKVSAARHKLFKDIHDHGAYIMHMAGTPEGVYVAEPGAVTVPDVVELVPRGYNTEKTIKSNGQDVSAVTQAANNTCPK